MEEKPNKFTVWIISIIASITIYYSINYFVTTALTDKIISKINYDVTIGLGLFCAFFVLLGSIITLCRK